MTNLSGLYCIKTRASVSLEGVHVEATIEDHITQVEVFQFYANNTDQLMETQYTFPLDQAAAVNSFTAEINGKVIEGLVKEKGQARREYNQAKRRGKTASLLEENKADIFTIKVGNVGPRERVNIRISYVAELREEGGEEGGIRFLLPTSIAPRYTPGSCLIPYTLPWYRTFLRCSHGCCSVCCHNSWHQFPRRICPSTSLPSLLTRAAPCALSVNINATMPSKILSVKSSSHCIQTKQGWDGTDKTANITFTHDSEKMDKDLLINFVIEGAHTARAVIEIPDAKPLEGQEGGKASGSGCQLPPCAMLTLVPDFKLDQVPIEAIFIVDRSGSMSGAPMKKTKECLELFLKSLPSDCMFNVIGFGSTFEFLFRNRSSVAYSEESLSKAISHVKRMSANLGGTELYSPLEAVFSIPPNPSYSRQIFVLTDGAVSNTEEIINKVAKHSQSCRLFSVGVGSSVSHALVEGMARAGRGTSHFIVSGERIEPKVMKQLSQAVQPALERVEICWGEGISTSLSPTSSLSSSSSSSSSSSAPPMTFAGKPLSNCHVKSLLGGSSPEQSPSSPFSVKESAIQSPYLVPPIYSGTRFIVFAFLPESVRESPPESVTLTASSPDGPLSIKLPLTTVQGGKLISTLAARSLIRDLEDGTSFLHLRHQGKAFFQKPPQSTINKEIVRLGTTFGLASSQTSFLAVDHSTIQTPLYSSPLSWWSNFSCNPHAQYCLNTVTAENCVYSEDDDDDDSDSDNDFGGMSLLKKTQSGRGGRGGYALGGRDRDRDRGRARNSYGDRSCSELRKRKRCNDRSKGGSRRSRSRSRSPARAPKNTRRSENNSDPYSPDSTLTVLRFAKAQSWNGSFTLDQVSGLINISIKNLKDGLSSASLPLSANSQDVWATALVICFLEASLSSSIDEWRMLAAKAKRWLGSSASLALKAAKEFLASVSITKN